ncbi:MAG: hypothetical protein GY820_01290 [Gammaproteobacteria bacterium]|nr:hypothetical protein [Gammaproteobacteria bacterium]
MALYWERYSKFRHPVGLRAILDISKSRQWSLSEKYGTNGSFLGKSDATLPFAMVSVRSDDEFPLKMAAEVKKVHFWALTHDHLEPYKFCKTQPILFVHASIDSP